MTPREYLDIIRARWRFLVAGLLLGVLAAAAVTLLSPRLYAADVTIYISARTAAGDASSAVDGADLVQQRIGTYVEVLTSERIATEVAGQLGGGATAGQIRDEISATSSPDTALITATATDTSPQRAADIANLVAARFVANVADLERSEPGQPPLVSAQVFEPAQPPTAPVSPRPVTNLALGALLGLLVGSVLAAVRHATDTSVKSREQLRRIVGVPVLGAIDADEAQARRGLVVHEEPLGRIAEAFRRLRTNLQFLDVDRNRKVWLVTSASPGDGKTTTVANLAAVMADAGSRVLVIEADLRRPRIAEILGVDRTVGLTNVLVRRLPGGQAVQHVRDGFDVLSSGPLPPNPSELLGSATMASLLNQAREKYDVVLLDASPLSPVTDAVALAPQADGVLLVVPYARLRRQQLVTASETLRAVSAPLLGSVMTMVPAKRLRRYAGDDAYLGIGPELGAPMSTDQALVPALGSVRQRTAGVPAATSAGPRTGGFAVTGTAHPIPSPRPRAAQADTDGEPARSGQGSDQASPPR